MAKGYMGTKLIASVADRETGKLVIIERDTYETKRQFREDLAGNGYSIHFIATEETFDEECHKYHERKEASIRRSKIQWASDKRLADKMGMTVAELRRWLKNEMK